MQDAWRAYLELALGATETSRKKAEKVARKLVGKGGATAAQLTAIAEEMVTTSAANREALVKLIRFEIDKTLGRVGLATAEEVADLNTRVRDLEVELRAERARADAAEAIADAPATSAAPATTAPAKKTVAKKTAAKKAAASIADDLAAAEPVATPAPAPAKKVAAKKTATKATAAKSAPTKATATKATATKATATKTVAKKTAAKKAAGPAKKAGGTA
ncbi:hypothetical protein SAMN05421812_1126 [Asanoa hainanensis]|uniref:Polyhydroxyalkanoate synthesis regulator phasin n=1 Tax=Asanoa hainanensis TaxID=560556 RepID=A0A239P0D5_9ACTN|nr:hypothetical protein [Asanoa hainanensis]SNT60074.1 hypothetical protein SAMN05421812_1126 [Asanoa hainanensis]